MGFLVKVLGVWLFVVLDISRIRPLPYCPLEGRVKIITKQRIFGRELYTQNFKRRTTWPYNCLHASILLYKGLFNYLPLIHKCCGSCRFPAFTSCMRAHAHTSSWRCPSQGLQCIVRCVREHDPNTSSSRKSSTRFRRSRRFRKSRRFGRFIRIRSRRFRRKVTAKIPNPKCERKIKKAGRDCIERLCIPIKF